MLSHPKIGDRAELCYGVKTRRRSPHLAALHGRVGVVRVVAKGPGPRNHGVELDGRLIVVPRGNLRKPK